MIFQEQAQEILQFVKANPVVGGIVGVGSVGSIIAYARNLPNRVIHFVKGQFEVTVTTTENDEVYFWLDMFLASLPSTTRTRYFEAKRINRQYIKKQDAAAPISCGNDDDCESSPKDEFHYILTPGGGDHWIWYKGHLYIVSRETGKPAAQPGGGGSGNLQSMFSPKSLSIKIIGRKKDRLEAFIDDAVAYMQSLQVKDNTISIHTYMYDHWRRSGKINQRSAVSVFTDNNALERMIEAAKKFTSRKEWYQTRGIPYRFGIACTGLPGTGKTSSAVALATEIGRSLYVLNINAILTDEALINAVQKVPYNAILLIEDMDTMSLVRAREDDNNNKNGAQKLSLSTLLNSIDGVFASEGRILIITSNHPEKIDPAMMRPGRIDLEVPFDKIGIESQTRMFSKFYERPDLVSAFQTVIPEKICPAELQNLFVTYAESPEDLIETMKAQSHKYADGAILSVREERGHPQEKFGDTFARNTPGSDASDFDSGSGEVRQLHS